MLKKANISQHCFHWILVGCRSKRLELREAGGTNPYKILAEKVEFKVPGKDQIVGGSQIAFDADSQARFLRPMVIKVPIMPVLISFNYNQVHLSVI